MPPLELTVTAAQSGRTVRSLLKYELGLSTARINRLKRTENGLKVNGCRVFTSAVLHTGDQLIADLDAAECPSDMPPVPMELDIVFEDPHLLVLNKPAFLAVIPSSLSPQEPALAGAVIHYLGPGAAFHPVNRLDRGTTGLMAVAKNGFIHDRLRRILHTSQFFRRYLAVCTGIPQPPEGIIDLPIGRAPGSAIQRQVCPDGQPAKTDYRVLSSQNGFSLVELFPHTGRTHQLRVHMAALGCPLAGDWLYGVEDRGLIPRPALHAASLSFTHPLTKQELVFTSPLPEDMNTIVERFVCPI